jgi:hypothetical protein
MRAQKSSKAWWHPLETVSGLLAYLLVYFIAECVVKAAGAMLMAERMVVEIAH